MKYLIVDGSGDLVFDGTLEQFRDCFFSNATDFLIRQWCVWYGLTVTSDD